MGYLGGTHGDLEVHFFRFETTETHEGSDVQLAEMRYPPTFRSAHHRHLGGGCPGTEVDGSMVRINGLQPQINPSIYFRSFTTHFPTIDSNFRPIQVGL